MYIYLLQIYKMIIKRILKNVSNAASFTISNQFKSSIKKADYKSAFLHFQNQHQLPNQKPIIFLQGMYGKKGFSKRIIQRIKVRDIFSIQYPNHYDPNRYYDFNTMDLYVEDLNHVAQYIGITKSIVVTNSFGASVASHYACRYPQKVESIIFWEYPPNYIFQQYEYLVTIQKKIQDMNPRKTELKKLIQQLLPKNVKELKFVSYEFVQYFADKISYYDQNGRFRWKINLDPIYNDRNGWLTTNNTNFIYPGPLHFISVTTDYPLQPEIFKKCYPNAKWPDDAKIFLGMNHFSGSHQKQGNMVGDYINWYINQFDKKHK